MVCPYTPKALSTGSSTLVFTLTYVVITYIQKKQSFFVVNIFYFFNFLIMLCWCKLFKSLGTIAVFLFIWKVDQDKVKKIDKTKLELEKAAADPLTLNPTM